MSFISPDDYTTFDPELIVIESAKLLQGEHGQKFHRLQIKYKYPKGGIGPLVVQTPVLLTYGVTMGSAAVKKDLAVPQISLVTCNSDRGPTSTERGFISVCEKILARIKSHMMLESTKEELGKWDMESDVRSMKIFYVKMEKGKPVKGYPPTLYSKLYYRLENNEVVITTRIDDAITGEPLPKTPLLGRAKIYATVIFPNVYVGNKPSLQTRVGEIMVVERNERCNYLKPLIEKSTETEDDAPPPVIKLKTLTRKY